MLTSADHSLLPPHAPDIVRVRVLFIQRCQQDGMKMELCLECLGFRVCRFLYSFMGNI